MQCTRMTITERLVFYCIRVRDSNFVNPMHQDRRFGFTSKGKRYDFFLWRVQMNTNGHCDAKKIKSDRNRLVDF